MTSYMPANAMFEFPDGEIVSNGGPSTQMKQGRICCGACCDMRRATIIVNIIMIVFLAFAAVSIFLEYEVITIAARESSADEDLVEASNQLKHMHIGWLIFYFLCQIAAYSVAIKGAIKFDHNMVTVGFVTYCFAAGVNVMILDLGGILMTSFFAYPHFFLAKEIKDNTMTPENYPNEVHSCCCTA